MLKILLLTKYPRLGASSRLRTLQYIPYLESRNIQVSVNSFFDEDYLGALYRTGKRSPIRLFKYIWRRFKALLLAGSYDLVWVEKEIFPYLPAFAEKWLKWHNIPYIVDYDDAIFHNYDLSKRRIVRFLLADKIDAVMKNSHAVIAGNQYLAERAARALAKRIEIIPTVVDHYRYQIDREKGSKITIGWIGSPSTQKYIIDIHSALLKVCSAYNAKILLVGATSDVVSCLPGLEVEVLPWSESGEVQTIARMDIGIMPLVDGPWEKGKCGYKLIQYMACGVPVVASAVGVNIDIVKQNECGLLAGDVKSWELALSKLLASEVDRERFGRAGRKAVASKYSLEAQAPELERIFRDVVIKAR